MTASCQVGERGAHACPAPKAGGLPRQSRLHENCASCGLIIRPRGRGVKRFLESIGLTTTCRTLRLTLDLRHVRPTRPPPPPGTPPSSAQARRAPRRPRSAGRGDRCFTSFQFPVSSYELPASSFESPPRRGNPHPLRPGLGAHRPLPPGRAARSGGVADGPAGGPGRAGSERCPAVDEPGQCRVHRHGDDRLVVGRGHVYVSDRRRDLRKPCGSARPAGYWATSSSASSSCATRPRSAPSSTW